MLTSKITTIEKRIISREKRIYIEFVMLSTARGFKNALKSKLFWRTIWIISLLAAWTFTIYQSTNLIIAYLRYDAVENIKIKTSAKIPFPAVTICNNNPFKYSLIRKLIDVDGIANTSLGSSIDYGNYSTAGLILDDILKGILMSERNDLGYGWGKQKRRLDILRYIALLKAFTYDFMLNYSMLGHSIESMLLTCSYQGDNCFTSNFSSFDHSVYGRCHTIIVDRSYKSLYGTTSGLVITLNVESAEYIPQLWSHLGFQVIIHPHEYVPFPEDTGFAISPGSATQVAIKQQLLTRLPYPYDNEDCGTISQSEINLVPYQNWLQLLMINNLTSQLNYSSLLCGKTCYLGLVYETCGCIDATYVTFAMAVEYFEANDLPNVTQYGVACNTANDNVWECVQNVAESVLDPSSKCIQECPQPCHEVKYQLNIKDNVWPQKSGTEYDAYLSMPQLINITPSDLTQHLVNLNVYFQDLTFETIVETPAMNVFGLLSSIGGTLGLFIGVGALNIVELIQMLFAVFGCTPAEYRPADNHQEATTDHKQNDGQVIHPKLTVDNQRGLWYDNNSAVSNISVINNYGLAVDQLKK